MLRAIRALGASQPIELSPTFMGAHEVPVEYRGRRDEYVRLVIDEMLPAVAARGPGRMERRVLRAGRVHARGVAAHPRGRTPALAWRRASTPTSWPPSGGVAGGGRGRRALGRSPDLHADEAGGRRDGRGPASSPRCCRRPRSSSSSAASPRRACSSSAASPVALATDMNPGGGFSPSMPFVIALAVLRHGPHARRGARRRHGQRRGGARPRRPRRQPRGRQADGRRARRRRRSPIWCASARRSCRAVIKRGAVVAGDARRRHRVMRCLAARPCRSPSCSIASPRPSRRRAADGVGHRRRVRRRAGADGGRRCRARRHDTDDERARWRRCRRRWPTCASGCWRWPTRTPRPSIG